jgi:hypothetical protein
MHGHGSALQDPSQYPDEFKSWLIRWIPDNAQIKLASYQLPDVQQTVYVDNTNGRPALAGAWVNFGGGYEVPGFYRDPWGRVFLCGEVKSGAAGSTIFTLPGGYRPKNREQFAVKTDTGVGAVDVSGNGDVIHITGGTGNVNLSGISFRAFQ